MDQKFKIYIDRLKNGHTEKIQEELDPAFLGIIEEELSFPTSVKVSGDAYLTDDHLILHLKAQTEAKIPCAICNDFFFYPIDIDFYHTTPLEEIINPIFDYGEALRDSILLQVPAYAECHQGSCPERNSLNKFLKTKVATEETQVNFPFSDL